MRLLYPLVALASVSFAQQMDDDFAKSVKEWTTRPEFISPLVDHLPKSAGVPSPKDVLGYYVGAPNKLTYYADMINVMLPRARSEVASRLRGERRPDG